MENHKIIFHKPLANPPVSSLLSIGEGASHRVSEVEPLGVYLDFCTLKVFCLSHMRSGKKTVKTSANYIQDKK